MSRQYISNLETGHVERPSREYAIKIAKVIKVDPNEVLLAAGYAPENISPMIQDLMELARVKRLDENYSEEERQEFREEMEYQITKAIERIIARRKKALDQQ